MKSSAPLMTLAVLLGALLLFGMEPMVGRMLVPFYGSAVSTWLTALVFFQVVLFGGYVYAHLIAPRIGKWHLLLLLLPLVNLPIGVTGEVSPEAPTFQILLALTWSIGIPFFVLSTTAVVLQLWWNHSSLAEISEPYPLYAASNTGSLVALIGYPFLIEPMLGLNAQSTAWTALYGVYVASVAAAFYSAKPNFDDVAQQEDGPDAPTLSDLALWATIAALPSGFLLAVTTVIATEVGSFPMIWIVPLAIYLGTFVLLFRDNPIGLGIKGYWPEITAVGFCATALSGSILMLAFALHIGVFFAYCMAMHGELYARRPAPRYLTRYYLAMSFGGGVGGIVVNFGPPVVFTSLWEYPLLMLAFAALSAALNGRELLDRLKATSLPIATIRLLVVQGGMALGLFGYYVHLTNPPLEATRNFYGIFRVIELEDIRLLAHGGTRHGSQLQDPARKWETPGLFYKGGGLHDAYSVQRGTPHTVAVIGLGAGVVGGLVDAGDAIDFYEIDPNCEYVARKWFTWLDDSPADIRVFVGDGRLRLDAMPPELTYDMVSIDAFNGDGIPSHLLTTEAIDGYLARLKPDGLMLFHISNRYYDLRPIVKAATDHHGMHIVFSPPADWDELGPYDNVTNAAVAARTQEALEPLVAMGWTTKDPEHHAEPWTDDYLNILLPLYWGMQKNPALK